MEIIYYNVHGSKESILLRCPFYPIKVSAGIFVQTNKLILKIIWKCKDPRIVKTTLKKKIKEEELTSDFKTL